MPRTLTTCTTCDAEIDANSRHATTCPHADEIRTAQRIAATITTPERTAALEWIRDCDWRDHLEGDEDFADHLTDTAIIRGIQRHYAGGWQQLLVDSLLREPTR